MLKFVPFCTKFPSLFHTIHIAFDLFLVFGMTRYTRFLHFQHQARNESFFSRCPGLVLFLFFNWEMYLQNSINMIFWSLI